MRSLTNRLRLSWLTLTAFAAFMIVGAIRPSDVSLVRLLFAHDLTQFKRVLSDSTQPPFETVALLRAQLAAGIMFLIAYGLLLRASLRALTSVPLGRLAQHGVVVAMLAAAAESLAALRVWQSLAEDLPTSPAWFAVMNDAAVTKWAVGGAVLLVVAGGWLCEACDLVGWRRRVGRVISALFAIGGLASMTVATGIVRNTDWVVTTALVASATAFLLQFRLLDTVGLMLRFLYLARVPLAILLALAAFGPVALGPAVGLLGGILVANRFVGVAVTTSAALAVLFACGTQINNVRAYGWERVRDDSLRVLDHEVFGACVFWTGLVAAGSLLFSVGLVSLPLTIPFIAAGVLAGAIGALALMFLIEWIGARLSLNPPGYVRPEPAIPFWKILRLRRFLEAAADRPPPAFKDFLVGPLVSRLFGIQSGYVERLPNGRRRILAGHTFAAVQFFLTVALFWLALYAKQSWGAPSFHLSASDTEAALKAPTVVSIVLLLLLSGWALAGVAFFIDRYRVTLFTVAVAAAFTTGGCPSTDYTVATTRHGSVYELATPAQVLQAFGDRPMVVAAAGGGIQAGAWTARVLSGLDKHYNGTLRDRVALISSVSGGSMAALYYGAYDGAHLESAAEQALKPSLDEIATAALSRDLLRILGVSVGHDRGEALERSWEERLPDSERAASTFRTWSQRASNFVNHSSSRPFPAFLFNSTIVEYGQPVAFATTQFPTHEYRTRVKDPRRRFPAAVESANRVLRLSPEDNAPVHDVGLKVVTAARLSASFPYVSPAARIDLEHVEPLHFVDGAYYDNYGLVALTQWVDDALEELQGRARLPTQIDVIVATGLVSPDSALTLRIQSKDQGLPALDRKIAPQGWRWQLTAPPATALNARAFAQRAGGLQLLQVLIDKWAGCVKIVPHIFSYPGDEKSVACQAAPLSWKLTAQQQKCITSAWDTFDLPSMGL